MEVVGIEVSGLLWRGPRLVGSCAGGTSYVLESDCTPDFLAGEDSLVVPIDEDADVARAVWRHGFASFG